MGQETLAPALAFNRAEIERSISDRFEKIVERYPQRLAIKTENEAITFAELNRAANRIAHAILAHPTTSQAAVLLFGAASPALPAILGTLKAAKFCVALDPAFPPRGLH